MALYCPQDEMLWIAPVSASVYFHLGWFAFSGFVLMLLGWCNLTRV